VDALCIYIAGTAGRKTCLLLLKRSKFTGESDEASIRIVLNDDGEILNPTRQIRFDLRFTAATYLRHYVSFIDHA
jgi:hypothetical protein